MTTADARAEAVLALRKEGFARLSAARAAALFGGPVLASPALRASWQRLALDHYLRDGGRYRRRRHGSYVQTFTPAALLPVPHRAHWQPTTYNALHGGMQRWFEPIEAEVAQAPEFLALVAAIGELVAEVRHAPRWFIEAHQFRIDTEAGIGRPTPEGAHRDGVDFVALALVERHDVRGGETHVFDAAGASGVRFTIAEPGSILLMDDERVMHETTPIQPAASPGWRDTLVLTYRAAGFQDPAP